MKSQRPIAMDPGCSSFPVVCVKKMLPKTKIIITITAMITAPALAITAVVIAIVPAQEPGPPFYVTLCQILTIFAFVKPIPIIAFHCQLDE